MEQLSVLYMVSIAAAPPAGLSASFHPTDACYYEHRRPMEAYGGSDLAKLNIAKQDELTYTVMRI